METFVTVVHVIVALFMILVVLLQGGNSGGVGAAFGGGNSQGVFGATGATSLLGKLTYAAAAIFMITSISLTRIQGTGGDIGAAEKAAKKAEELQKAKAGETPAEQPADDVPKSPESGGE